MPTVFLDAVFKPFFKVIRDTGQQLTIDRTNFLTYGFHQIIQRTGFVSVNTWFQISPKEKITRWKIGRTRGQGTSLKREMRCPGNMFRTMVIDWFAVCAVAPSCWKRSTQRKRMPTTSSPPSAYLLSTTHSKDVRFPWVTLYKARSGKYEISHDISLKYK